MQVSSGHEPDVSLRTASLFAACLTLCHLALFAAIPDGNLRTAVNDTAFAVEGLLVGGSLVWVARRLSGRSRRLARAWLFLAMAQLAYTCGDIVWVFGEIGRGYVAGPAIAGWLYLAEYPLLLTGLWLLRPGALSSVQRRRTLLEGGMIVCGAALGYWTLLIEPTFAGHVSAPLQTQLASLAYAVGDFLLLWAVTRLAFAAPQPRTAGALRVLIASAAMMVITDSLYGYQALRGTYVSGGILDMGWLISMLLLGLAGLAYLRSGEDVGFEVRPAPGDAAPESRMASVSRLLPYVSACGAYVLLALDTREPPTADQVVLKLGVAVLVGLVLLRQSLEARENTALSRRLRLANDQLEWRVEQRTADLKAANAKLAIEITERRQAQAALQDSEQHFRSLAESASDAIVGTDSRGRVAFWNPGAEAMFGRTADEMVSVPVQTVLSGYLGQLNESEFALALAQYPTGYRSKVFEGDGRRPDGSTFPMEFSFALWSASQGTFVTAIVRDVSERCRMEQQLAQARKLESIGQLAAGIAHELNTPAQYVGSNLRFLRDRLGAPLVTAREMRAAPDGQGDSQTGLALARRLARQLGPAEVDFLLQEVPLAIEQSLEGMARVNSIVSAMKDFSHPGSSAKAATDINRALTSTLTVACNEYKHVADVTTDMDPSLPMVQCYAAELNQVFLNIIVNAAQAIEDVVGDSGEQRGTIAVSSHLNGGWVEVRISDTGQGIPEGIAARVFDPFFTTKDVGRGTGQGLSIAYSVIQKHGGELAFDSKPGTGTTFTIRLPVGA